MGIDYKRFQLVTKRSVELVGREDVNKIVKVGFEDFFETPGTRYLRAYKALEDAERSKTKERDEALAILDVIDQPYIETRTALGNYIDELAIPKTLKSIPIGIDKRDAIARVLELINEHKATERWAQVLSEEPIATLGPVAIKEINDWIRSQGDIEKAVRERQNAYKEAYPQFLKFRNQVRSSYGDNSIHYRELVVRSSGKLEVDDIETEDVDDADNFNDVDDPIAGGNDIDDPAAGDGDTDPVDPNDPRAI